VLVELDSLYRDCPEAPLFHYTSNAAVLGIVESKAFWATEARYLNDSSELVNAFNCIGWAALERAQSHTGELAALLRDFHRWCEGARTTDRTVFVVSLTGQGNLLSQWRAYAGSNGQGASLAFDAKQLKVLGARQGFRLGRCIYDQSEQRALAERVVDHLLSTFPGFDWELNKPAGHESVRFYPLFDSLSTEVMSLAALMKHSAFYEEAEWRLVSSVVPSARLQGVNFRPGRSCVVPYLKFDLVEEDGTFCALKGANIGPCQNPNLAMASLRMLFDRHVQGGTWLRNLLIPLRASV